MKFSAVAATAAILFVTSPALADGPTVLSDEEMDQVIGGLLYLGTDHNSVILPTDVDLVGTFSDHSRGLTCISKDECTNKTSIVTWGTSFPG